MQPNSTHIFSSHNLAPFPSVILPREASYNLTIFIFLVSASTLLLFVFVLYFKKIVQLVQGVFSYSSSKQFQREGYSFFKFFSLALTAVYIICASIFFSDLNERMQWIK